MMDANIRALLLDIEGTTTPVEFVYEILFPFARRHAGDFIRQRRNAVEVRACLDGLRAEQEADAKQGNNPPVWRDDAAGAESESATRYIHWLMDQDRKSTALKSLQGMVWEAGYLSGGLRGAVFEDVPPAFARWREQGRAIYIFSSGSVLAQKLLFTHTTYGDLTAYIAGYFDTTTCAKTRADSYRSICVEVRLPAALILFVSDVTAELDAARAAGLPTALCVRGERPAPEAPAHTVVGTFDVIFP